MTDESIPTIARGLPDVDGTWVIAIQVSKNDGGSTAHSMLLADRRNCSEAEALKSAFEGVKVHKPGFSIDQWLTTFVPATPTLSTLSDTGEI